MMLHQVLSVTLVQPVTGIRCVRWHREASGPAACSQNINLITFCLGGVIAHEMKVVSGCGCVISVGQNWRVRIPRPKIVLARCRSLFFTAALTLSFVATAGADSGLLLLADGIEPTMRDVYGVMWFLLVPFFLALWLLGAELIVRVLSAFSTRDKAILSGAAGAGMAIGASYQPSGRPRERGDTASAAFLGLLVFGIFMLAMFLLSKRLVTYPLAVVLFMMSYASATEHTAHEMAVEEARNNPDMILPIEQISLATNPALVGSGGLRVALRVNNGSGYDLVGVRARCSFYLRNGNVAHENTMRFSMDYRVPPGFGARVESSGSVTRQFDAADYADRVRCDLISGELRTVESASAQGAETLEVLTINEGNETIRVKNASTRGISSLELECLGTAVSGFGQNARALGTTHAGWIRYGSLRREFRRDGEPMIRPNTEETLKFSGRSEHYSGDSSHRLRPASSPMRCDISRLRWHSGG